MTAGDGLARIQAVNKVRKYRLERELRDAQHAQHAAEESEQAAVRNRDKQHAIEAAAKSVMLSDPGCEQTRLWQSVSAQRAMQATEEHREAGLKCEDARARSAHQARAVHRHDLKMDWLDERGRKLARAQDRANEIRNEDT